MMLVNYLLVGYLYGIESERKIEQEIQVNMAHRWFLGLDIGERVPNHSTISQNRRKRFRGENLFYRLFERILRQYMENGLVEQKHVAPIGDDLRGEDRERLEYINNVMLRSLIGSSLSEAHATLLHVTMELTVTGVVAVPGYNFPGGISAYCKRRR